MLTTKRIHIGRPDVAGPLAVFPLFTAPAGPAYVSFARARQLGAAITELPGHASVNDLLVHNPTGEAVLLYEGEEVLGAQQNRTFDVTVLVAPGSKLQVPVSCVEAGRWEAGRHGESFAPAPQAAYPALRRAKNRVASAAAAAGETPRADQSEVWREVGAKSARMRVDSRTGAMSDIFDGQRDQLRELQHAIVLRPGQTGALAAIGGRFAVLDHVSRPEVFADLHAPLVQGYALDALEATPAPAPSLEQAELDLDSVVRRTGVARPSLGLGEDVRLPWGAGLRHEHELVQLTAFAPDTDEHPALRIRRPSRRRP